MPCENVYNQCLLLYKCMSKTNGHMLYYIVCKLYIGAGFSKFHPGVEKRLRSAVWCVSVTECLGTEDFLS
jgi:hypothetical protein